MRVLACEISLGDFTFDFITDVNIETSWDTLTDTCDITLPRKLRYRLKSGKLVDYIVSGTEAVFKRGDYVQVRAGYIPNPEFGEISVYNTIFTGYILTVEPNKPIKIHCEDESYKLKTVSIDKYSIGEGQAEDLGELLTNLLDQANSEVPEEDRVRIDIIAESMEIGPTVFEAITFAEVIEYLKRTYGLKAYFRENTLYIGFARVTQNNTQNTFQVPNKVYDILYGRDVISESSLVYQNDADIDIALTCISIADDNTRIESTAGSKYGAKRNLYYYNETQESLDKIAEAMVSEFKYNGYSGSFTMFGIPNLEHGDAVTLKNSDIADHTGTYILTKVVKRFGTGGYRQEVTLGPRIRHDG